MPYIDPEKRRLCSKLSARKKRALHPEESREYNRNYQKKWNKANPGRYKARRQRERANPKTKLVKETWYKMMRRRVLEHYGGTPPTCQCCGESEYEFLTLEHLNGGGTKHRMEAGPSAVCPQIVRLGFPDGYSVLCYNCNCGKQHNKGVCPHKMICPQLRPRLISSA